MNRIKAVLNRESGIANDFTYDFALRRLCVAKEDSWRGIMPSNYNSDYNPEPPIFSAKFANCSGYRHILAIANEDGKIALQDTTRRNYEPEEMALNAPQCHYNAVFDLEWAPGQMKFVSASGDHTARLWEVDGPDIRSVRAFVGHTRSVKTAAFRRDDASVFATGGRDGAIIIWDTRANLNVDLTPRADNCIYSGHVGGPGTPISQKRRTRIPKVVANTTSSSITGLVFQDANTLISCGAGDGIIKVWDLRRNYTTYKKEPHPKHSLPYAGSSTFKGFTNLVIDQAGAQLFANCMDNTIYCYNLFSYVPEPLARYKGLLNSTFYIKACLSFDGKYLLSGSSDEKAYIWNLKHPDEPLVSLAGHTVEVTCVAWSAVDGCPIVTCSDDARHKIWRIGPDRITESDAILYKGRAEYVRKFGVKSAIRATGAIGHKYNLRDLESTPRSLKRLVEQNERTPSLVEKVATKRSYLEILGVAPSEDCSGKPEQKRLKTLESKGRRLFSPSSSKSTFCSDSSLLSQCAPCLNAELSALLEQSVTPSENYPASNQENNSEPLLPYVSNKMLNSDTPSSHNERLVLENQTHMYSSVSPANTTAYELASSSGNGRKLQSLSSVIFSPTSNLPNYVLDGEAPHLGIMSPKRKHKHKVDWLTKIRKQKQLSSFRATTFIDKISEERNSDKSDLSSPRLRSLRKSEGNPHLDVTPRRSISHSGQLHDASSPSTAHPQIRTPTSSRRNSETTLLRFFSVHTLNRNSEDTFSSSVCTTHIIPSTETPTATAHVDVNRLQPLLPPSSLQCIRHPVSTTYTE